MLTLSPLSRVNPIRIALAALWLVPILFAMWVMVTLARHQLQPRDFVGTELWAPQETYWAIGDGRQGAIGTFQAVLVYPSGTTKTHQIFPTQLDPEGRVCVELRVGRWTQDYHIKLIRPDLC